MGIDNLNDPRASDRSLRRSSAVQGTASPGGNTSVSEGAFEIRSNEGLLVSGSAKVDGWLVVTGTERVTGLLEILGQLVASGTIKFTGSTRFEGDTTQVGPFHIQGATDITGALSVNGLTTLLKTLTVATGGKIVVGNMTLDPAAAAGGTVGAITAPVAIALQANNVFTSDMMTVSTDLYVNGAIHSFNAPTTTGSANVFMDTLGIIKKITSGSKYKDDVKKLDLPDELLHVQVKDWVDKAAADRLAGMDSLPRPLARVHQDELDGLTNILSVRVPGVIAEEVEAAGGESFVTYDANGEVEGVAYDRFALARTEILARKVAELEETVERLTKLVEGH